MTRFTGVLFFLTCFSSGLFAQPEVIVDYPWLLEISDFSDCEEINVTEYDLGPYAYVVVETQTGTDLYFENGSLFCSNSSTFDCVVAYSLQETDIGLEYGCMEMEEESGLDLMCIETNVLFSNNGFVSASVGELVANFEDYLTAIEIDTLLLTIDGEFEGGLMIISGGRLPSFTFQVPSANLFSLVEYQLESAAYGTCGGQLLVADVNLPSTLCMSQDLLSGSSLSVTDIVPEISELLQNLGSLELKLFQEDLLETYLITSDAQQVNVQGVLEEGTVSYTLSLPNSIPVCDGFFLYDKEEVDEETDEEESEEEMSADDIIFEKYPWLSMLLDPGTCESGRVTEYDLEAYTFLMVETSASSILYFQDGTLYCTNSPTYDCLAAYNLSEDQIGLVFGCMDMEEDEENEDDPMSNESILDDYPWLIEIIALDDCQGAQVDVYRQGVHDYISVTTVEIANIYYADGSLLCTGSSTFDCQAAYGFGEDLIVQEFDCTDE